MGCCGAGAGVGGELGGVECDGVEEGAESVVDGVGWLMGDDGCEDLS